MNDIYGRAGGYLSVTDVAEDLKVTRATVLRFIYLDYLPATNVGDGNYRPRYGVSLDDLNKFKKTYVRGKVRIPNAKKPGRKPKEKVEVKPKVVEVVPDKKDEIKEIKEALAFVADKLLEISIKLEELSK